MYHPDLARVAAQDARYAYEAYEFIYKALSHTQKMLGREPPADATPAQLEEDDSHHVRGRELLEGIRALALLEFGLMARTVFHCWGVRRTEDFGNILFNLVEAKLMHKADEDTLADFRDVFDFEQALVHDYRIPLD